MQHDTGTFDFNAYGGRDYGIESPSIPSTSTTTAKQTTRAMRVWLENKAKLEQAGFSAGASYTATYGAGVIVLTVDANGKGKVSACKRGDSVRPIIDLHNASVAATFAAGQALTVSYTVGTIVIK